MKITEIAGIEIGHATHPAERTGCTVVLCREGAVAGIDIRGSAPGTRETELLQPTRMIRQVHAVMLTGGSAYGLRTADGAMDYLAEQGIGFQAPNSLVPIVPAAVIFDLYEGRDVRLPDAAMGYRACREAGLDYDEGRVGVGTGARVGKLLGAENSMPGGVAAAATELPGGARIGAIAVANALGDIIDPGNGRIVAGARHPQTGKFIDSYEYLLKHHGEPPPVAANTTLAVVATDAKLDKEAANMVARMAQSGITRCTRPAHTQYDGDLVIALSTGERLVDINVVGMVAARMVSAALLRAIRLANQG